MRVRTWAVAVVLAATWPAGALAGGFEVPDNGSVAVSRGAAFTVKADDLTAVAHNPAGLLRGKGTRLQWSHNVLNVPTTFRRAETGMPHKPYPPGVDPLVTVENQTPIFALGGMLFAASDFGLEDWAFAVGAYGPSATGHQEYPVSGGQRYMLTKLDVLLAYYSAAVAWGKRDRFGLGLTLQLAHQPKTQMSLVVDGGLGGDLAPYYTPTDVVATIDVKAAPAFTAILGGWWRLAPNWELGASGRVMPAYLHGKGDITLTNTPTGSQFNAKQLSVDGSAAQMELVIPPTAKVGARYRHLEGEVERFDVELDLAYEAWSMLNQYDIQLQGMIHLFANKAAPDHVRIAKAWRDTVGARLGGTYNFKDLPLSLSAGTFVETGATPNDYSHLDFPSFNRLGVAGGVRAKLGHFDLSLSYAHVFQETRTVSEAYARVYQQRPVSMCPDECTGPDGVHYDGAPANSGRFTSSFDILSGSVQVAF